MFKILIDSGIKIILHNYFTKRISLIALIKLSLVLLPMMPGVDHAEE
jgi:exosortase/archaeosortase